MAAFASPAIAFATTGTAADFEGAWDTVIVEVNAHYRLYLHHDGNSVEGNFDNKQAPQYSGTLKGEVQDGRLYFTYVQPNANSAGDGSFTIGSDGKISGVVRTTVPAGDGRYYVWERPADPSTAAAHANATTTTPVGGAWGGHSNCRRQRYNGLQGCRGPDRNRRLPATWRQGHGRQLSKRRHWSLSDQQASQGICRRK